MAENPGFSGYSDRIDLNFKREREHRPDLTVLEFVFICRIIIFRYNS